uniref:Fucosyltransferase C-terminal domain-containing protein n=1 Tax=viral metagenome TaxID=1070528 RepID=A0A6C0HV58_9ZZZZ
MDRTYNQEGFSTKIQLNNWWDDSNTKNIETCQHIFQQLLADTKKDVVVYSVFGQLDRPIKSDNTILVQFSGESIFHDPAWFDLNFIPVETDYAHNIVMFPYAYFHILYNHIDIQKLTLPRTLSSNVNKKFCLFAVSNGNAVERKEMYVELSKYKPVDSCGKFMNNMNMNCPESHNSTQYFDFISDYKFMICFENTSKPNYVTEKLINAYLNGTVPIYWGCPNIQDYVNMDSILYLSPNYTIEERAKLIQKIIYLDTHPDAYQSMYEKIFFKNGQIPPEFNLEKIKEKISTIL